jgi:hypothetical protein
MIPDGSLFSSAGADGSAADMTPERSLFSTAEADGSAADTRCGLLHNCLILLSKNKTRSMHYYARYPIEQRGMLGYCETIKGTCRERKKKSRSELCLLADHSMFEKEQKK